MLDWYEKQLNLFHEKPVNRWGKIPSPFRIVIARVSIHFYQVIPAIIYNRGSKLCVLAYILSIFFLII
ncbi:hypothetical protein ABF86_02540 [Nitrosomonas sp. GH22]|nr:hypothetical protein [Nitrosomonas sp. GH22]